MTLYAPDLEAQRAWVAALRKAGEQVYDAEELRAKATALQEMAPLLLDQAQRQFKRMHQILASLKCTGYVVQDERVKSLKKVRDSASFPDVSELQHCVDGVFVITRESTRLVSRRGRPTQGYLEFQRAEYEDEQFYGKLLEDSSTSEPRFAKAYCVLRSDQTLVYGSSEKEAKANPEGVVSLNHLHVVLDADAIEKSGDMVFSLVTPLRTFVVRAAHQVALEEWLKAIIRSTAKLDDKGNTLQALNELQEMDATEGVDLASLIDDDSGLDAFERFVSTLEDKKTKDVFACWRLCREHKDASEFDPLEFADTSVLVKQLEKRLVEDFLEDGGRLPEEIAVDARKECIAAMYPHGEKALPVNEVRAACVAELHSLAYEEFKKTQDYKEYCISKKDLGEPVEEGERVLIYTPKDPAALKERLAKMPKCSTKLKSLDAIKNGSGKRVYEAWTSLKHSSEKTERVMIGRDHKCDVAVDDDKRVSREHARIDSLKDGRVVFLDLGSSHGSKVNGKTVSGRVFLNAGDVVHVGKTDMVFTVIPSGTMSPLR